MIGDGDDAESAPRRADPRRRRRRRERGHHAAGARRSRRLEPREPRHRPAAARCSRRGVVAEHARPRTRRRPRSARSRSAGSRMPRPSPIRPRWVASLGEQLRARRHRPRLDAADALARAARRDPRPAAVRAGHRRATCAARADSPSTALLAAWLRLALDVPVDWAYLEPEEWPHGIKSVRLVRDERRGPARASDAPAIAILTQPGQPDPRPRLPAPDAPRMPRRGAPRLDPDVLYGRVITEGWELLGPPAATEPPVRRMSGARTHERVAWLRPGPRSAW